VRARRESRHFESTDNERAGQMTPVAKLFLDKSADQIGKDGAPVGTVDRVEGTRIKLTKKDNPSGHQDHHHYIDMQLVGSVEGDTVKLSIPAAEALKQEIEEPGQKVYPARSRLCRNLLRGFLRSSSTFCIR
jgi:hypothetical protein